MTSRQASIICLVGAIMAAAGGVLPWANVGAFEVSGAQGDGLIALGGGAIAALIAFVAMERRTVGVRFSLTLIGVLLGILYVTKVAAIADLGDPDAIFSVGIGIGIWIGLAGSVILALFGWAGAQQVEEAGPTPPVAPASSGDEVEQSLEALRDLRDRGVITPDEYAEQRRAILARL